MLSHFFETLLPVIEADLKTVLHPPSGSPPLFYRMLHYHMGWVDSRGRHVKGARGGKRIRPVLCLLTCEAVSGDYEPARPAAAAVELIHNFSLLHDDIEDHSPTRRNRRTVWAIWGEQQAINAGDTLFVLAHLAIPRLTPAAGLPAEVTVRLLHILDETSLELTRGQHLDMSFEGRSRVSTGEYLDMIAGKTAALLAASAWMGALSGGADDQAQMHYRAFGENLGMAFQVMDDILDIWGDPSVTGKEAAIDIRQRKKSLPVLHALAHSPELQELYSMAEPFDEATVSRVIRLLDQTGAREYAEETARRYSEETLACLEAVGPEGEAGQALFELTDRLLHRDR